MSGSLGKNGPFLVLSPLSVMENWRSELERCGRVSRAQSVKIRRPQPVCDVCDVCRRSFAPSLAVLCYKGDKERRAELQRETDTQAFTVLLTTYEVRLSSEESIVV